MRNETLGFVIFPTYLDLDFLSPTSMLLGNLKEEDRFHFQDVKCGYSVTDQAAYGTIWP
jgi:hypothetical protein